MNGQTHHADAPDLPTTMGKKLNVHLYRRMLCGGCVCDFFVLDVCFLCLFSKPTTKPELCKTEEINLSKTVERMLISVVR